MNEVKQLNAGAEEPPGSPLPVALPARSVTFRAVLLALLLMPGNALWIMAMERWRGTGNPTTFSLFFNCIFELVVLTGLNGLAARFFPRHAFRQGELLLIYAMLCIASCMAGIDMVQVLVPTLVWPYGQATPQHKDLALFGRFLPAWAMVPNVEATRGFFLGNDTLYTKSHLYAWLPAALIWSGFILVLLFTMQCVNVLLRKQWMENEKLTFPLVQLPMQITDFQPGGRTGRRLPLTKNTLFWVGFVLAACIDGANSLNYYFPAVPSVLAPGNGQASLDLSQFFTAKPWNAITWMPAAVYPFIVGIGMFMPLDFLFSSWFFYLFWKLQNVLVAANAWDADPRMPYANYQAFGAYFLFLVSTLWLSRHYFRQVVLRALGRPSEVDNSDEPLRYRSAFLGLAGGLCVLVAFSMEMGLAGWLAVLFFLIYLSLALAITRMRAELGSPVHDLHFTGPDWALTDLLGPRAIGGHGLAVFSVFFWFNRAYRAHPMPFQLEAFKMAEQTGLKRPGDGSEMRGWFWALLLAGGFGMLCAFWALLHLCYQLGAVNKIHTLGPEGWVRYAGWLKQPQPANSTVASAMGGGFLFAAFLQAMRVRFFWWPFHPLAYAVSSSWEMNLVWMPLLIAWVIKSVLLRYGGIKTYQASLPFFYGIILGQFIPGSLLNIWGLLTQNPTYPFW